MAATEQCPDILQPGMTHPLVKIINMLGLKSFLNLCRTSKAMYAFCMNTRGITIVVGAYYLREKYLNFHNTPFVVHLLDSDEISMENADQLTKRREELKKHLVKSIGYISVNSINQDVINEFVAFCRDFKVGSLVIRQVSSSTQVQALFDLDLERLTVTEVAGTIQCMKSRIRILNEQRMGFRVSLAAMDSVVESWLTNDLKHWEFYLNISSKECINFCKKYASLNIREIEGSLPTQRPLFLYEKNGDDSTLWIVKANDQLVRIYFEDELFRVGVKCQRVIHYGAYSPILAEYFKEKRMYAGLSWRLDKEVGVYDLMDTREQLASRSIYSLHHLVVDSLLEDAFNDFVVFCQDFKLCHLDIRQVLSNTQFQALLAMDLKCLRVRGILAEVESFKSSIPELEIHGAHLSLAGIDSIIRSTQANDPRKWRFFFKDYQKECLDINKKYATADVSTIEIWKIIDALRRKQSLVLLDDRYGAKSLFFVKEDGTVSHFRCAIVGETKVKIECDRLSKWSYPSIIREAYEKWDLCERNPTTDTLDLKFFSCERITADVLAKERENLSSLSIQSVHHVEVDFLGEGATGEFVAFCRDYKVRRLDIRREISNEQLQALLTLDLEHLKVYQVQAVSSLNSAIPNLFLTKTRSSASLAAMDSVIESWLTNDLIKWKFLLDANKEECLEILKKYAPLDLKEIGDFRAGHLPAQACAHCKRGGASSLSLASLEEHILFSKNGCKWIV